MPEKQPYELLVRWDVNGGIAGAHVIWRSIFKDDEGEVLAEKVHHAEPIGTGSAPFYDLMTEAQHAALAENSALEQRIAALEAELQQKNNEIEDLRKQLQADAEVHANAVSTKNREIIALSERAVQEPIRPVDIYDESGSQIGTARA